MPVTENQGSFLNRISIRRNQIVASIDSSNDQEQEDFDVFIKHVGDRFSALLPAAESPCAAQDPPPLLTFSWFHDLLDAFLCCESQFKAVLLSGREPSHFSRPPLDRLVPDLLDRSVKALDVLNAVTNGFDLVQHWQKLAQIAVAALRQTPAGDGQVRRARRALAALLTSMCFDDKENASNNSHGKWAERTKSFWRRIGGAIAAGKDRPTGNLRSLSWSVAKSWSAAKQGAGDAERAGGAAGGGGGGAGDAGVRDEHDAGVRSVGAGGGGAVPGEARAGDAFPDSEELELGAADHGAAGEDRRGVEEEGEERNGGAAGGAAEDGGCGALSLGVRGRVRVPAGGREGGGDGGAGGGAGGGMPEDGGGDGAAAAAG